MKIYITEPFRVYDFAGDLNSDFVMIGYVGPADVLRYCSRQDYRITFPVKFEIFGEDSNYVEVSSREWNELKYVEIVDD